MSAGNAVLPVVDYVTVRRGCLDAEAVASRFAFPVFVKPANLGSSVGISKVNSREELGAGAARGRGVRPQDHRGARHRGPGTGVRGARQRGSRGLACRARSCPRANSTTTRTSTCWTSARTQVPADLPPENAAELRRLAVECYRAVECEGMARVDFLLENATGQLYINEINTIPGFTSISMYPKMWEHSGIPFAALVDRLIEFALARHETKKATRYTR